MTVKGLYLNIASYVTREGYKHIYVIKNFSQNRFCFKRKDTDLGPSLVNTADC